MITKAKDCYIYTNWSPQILHYGLKEKENLLYMKKASNVMNNFVWRSNYSPFCRFALYLETKIRNYFSVIIVWLLFFIRRKGRDWGRYPCKLFIKRLIISISYKRVDQKIFHILVYGNICIIHCLYIMRL